MAMDRPESADELEEIAAMRRREAETLGVPRLALDVYKCIHFWPEVFADPEMVDGRPSPFILSAEKKEDEAAKSKTISVRVADGRSITMRLDEKESDADRHTSSDVYDLSILVGGKSVFTATLRETGHYSSSDAYFDYAVQGVSGFVPGDWLNDLRDLFEKIEAAEEAHAQGLSREREMTSERRKELKDRFGI